MEQINKSGFARMASKFQKKSSPKPNQGNTMLRESKKKIKRLNLRNIGFKGMDPGAFSDYIDGLPDGASSSLYSQLISLALSPMTKKQKCYIPSNYYTKEDADEGSMSSFKNNKFQKSNKFLANPKKLSTLKDLKRTGMFAKMPRKQVTMGKNSDVTQINKFARDMPMPNFASFRKKQTHEGRNYSSPLKNREKAERMDSDTASIMSLGKFT